MPPPPHPSYSRRLPFDAPENRLHQALSAERARGAEVLDLTESNPTRAGIAYPEAAIAAALSSASRRCAVRYDPDPCGARPARVAVSAYYAARGCDVDPDEIVLTASTSESYSWLFKLLCDPGDTILAPRPSYPLLELLAGLEGVRIGHYPLRSDDAWHVDFAALQQELDAVAGAGGRVRALVLVHPNNPTGSLVRAGDRARLCALAARHDLSLIIDEVFGDYAHGEADRDGHSFADEAGARCYTLSGLSKVLGLPQLKLGWIVASGPERRERLAQLELVADTFLSVSAVVAEAAPELLALGPAIRGAIQERVARNRAALVAAARGTACQLLVAEGGWYGVLRVPALDDEEAIAIRLLQEDAVLTQPGYFYDFERGAHLVLSLLAAPEIFDEGVARIIARLGHP